MDKKILAYSVTCGHCANVSRMEVVGDVKDIVKKSDPFSGEPLDYGVVYLVALCPSCNKANVLSYFWDVAMESNDEIEYEVLYPKDTKYPLGLPPKILNAYKAAEKVKNIDGSSYALLMRRLLEMVCIDRKAKGKTLHKMLEDLAGRHEIPEKLVAVANGLRGFGNIGAHPVEGELGAGEAPIVNSLTNAILEYIYSAPYLADMAERELERIKKRK